MAFSEGEIWTIGFYHTVSFRPISSPRSLFPTSNFFPCLPVWIVGGLFLSSQCYDSLFSHLLEINYCRKPPWVSTYIHHSPVSLFSSPVSGSYRQQSASLMGDQLRNSVPDLTLGFGVAPITLSLIEFCAVSTNCLNLVVTTVHSLMAHLSALIGPRFRVLGLADNCVGRYLNPGMVRFMYRHEESMNWVLLRVSWPFNDRMLTIHWCFLNIIEEACMLLHFWIRITGTLSLYLTNDMVKFAGLKIGLISAVDFEANVHSTGFVRVQMIWICDKVLLLNKKSTYFLALMEFTQFGRLENVLVPLRWVLLVIRGSGLWDYGRFICCYVEEDYTGAIFQRDFGTEVLVPLCLHSRISLGHIGFNVTFCKKRSQPKLLSTIRNKEKSNMKLDNNRFFDRLASKATLRKASSNSLLLYFLLLYGTYICVCNNCISLFLYVFVITLLV